VVQGRNVSPWLISRRTTTRARPLTNIKDATHNGLLEAAAIFDGRTNRAFGQQTVSFYGDATFKSPTTPPPDSQAAMERSKLWFIFDPAGALGVPSDGTIFAQANDGLADSYYYIRRRLPMAAL